MNTFNESSAKSITNKEIKIIAGIIALALLVTILFIYFIPYFYSYNNIPQKNMVEENSGNFLNSTNKASQYKVVTPIEVNI